MQAINRPFTKIVNGATQFIIPVFQRDYRWTETNCGQLWNDVIQVARSQSDRGHFIGSVVCIPTGDNAPGFTRWLLIDGQQRVTTIILLLAALRDHIEETDWQGDDDGPTPARINDYFLKNSHEQGSRHHKLVLRRYDQETLKAIIEYEEGWPENTSIRLQENYEFFRERLLDADPAEVYRGVGRLVVVDVTLDRGIDDPQLVFESLNSTGMDLSQSDLIRNFLLMRLAEKEQTRLYEGYWSKVESLFRGSESTFDAFVRDYMALKTKASKQEKADAIYQAFRRLYDGLVVSLGNLENVLTDVLRYATYHAAFSIGSNAFPDVAEPLGRLRRLVDVPATLIMRLFDCYDRTKTLSAEDFSESVTLLESYVFRRAICGEQTRGYWQVFANMAYRIDEQSPLDSLKVCLARQGDSYRFPHDDEFRRALQEKDLYGLRVCWHLLERLENHGHKEPTHMAKLSIEHVMPQNEKPRPAWQRMLGKDWKEVHNAWCHRLGNLTLTAYNSTYSDRPFEDKKKIEGGFEDSAVRLNKFIREQSQWTENEMNARGKKLAKRSLEIWPSLKADQAAVEKANQADLRELAARCDVGKVQMTDAARALFDQLRPELNKLSPDLLELTHNKSVSYHAPGFFVEVLPRKHQLTLLLPLEYSEIDDSMGIAGDATEWKFFINAEYDGGVYLKIGQADDIEAAMPIIRQAHNIANAAPV